MTVLLDAVAFVSMVGLLVLLMIIVRCYDKDGEDK